MQTGGPGQVNIPTEKINELGNYKSVATVRDTPDLQFSLESFDTSTEVEALVSGQYVGRTVSDAEVTATDATLTSATAAFTAADVGRQVIIHDVNDGPDFVTTIASVTSGTEVELDDVAPASDTGLTMEIVENGYDLAKSVPVDFASQFKAGLSAADPTLVTASVAVPFVYLEQMSYRFGLRDNASQAASFRGDSIFYNPGACFVQTAAGTNTPGQTVVTANAAYEVAQGDERRVLAVTVGSKRLSFGIDYSESYGAVSNGAAVTTITLVNAVPTTETVRLIYSSPATLQYDQSVHPSAVVKPAAIKGRDIEIYIGGYDPNDIAGSQANKVGSVQAVTTDWRVTIDKDEEFGNYYTVGQDFADVPVVNGTIDFKPVDPQAFIALVQKVSNVVDSKKVVGTATSTALALDIVIKNPNDGGRTLKRLHVPDARFTPPGYSARVNTKQVVTLNYESDEGVLLAYKA